MVARQCPRHPPAQPASPAPLSRLAKPGASCAAGGEGNGVSCPWKLDRYEPSEWEKEWVDGGEDLQNIVCQARTLLWVCGDICTQLHLHSTHAAVVNRQRARVHCMWAKPS